jgi:hypothetical protein
MQAIRCRFCSREVVGLRWKSGGSERRKDVTAELV